jgi:hypothetical protein
MIIFYNFIIKMYTYNQRYDKNKYVWKVKPVYIIINQYIINIY